MDVLYEGRVVPIYGLNQGLEVALQDFGRDGALSNDMGDAKADLAIVHVDLESADLDREVRPDNELGHGGTELLVADVCYESGVELEAGSVMGNAAAVSVDPMPATVGKGDPTLQVTDGMLPALLLKALDKGKIRGGGIGRMGGHGGIIAGTGFS